MSRMPLFLKKLRGSTAKLPVGLEAYSLLGAGIAILILTLFYLLLVAPESDELSTPAAIVVLLIAASPLIVTYRIQQTTGVRIFSDFSDFSIAIAWFPLTLLAMCVTENSAMIVFVMACGFLVDPIKTGAARRHYPPATRVMFAYARGLCGIIGTILALTFVAKLMDIGNPKNKKGVVQEILGVVIWGYIGKSFFDFIGVTKPIDLAGMVSRVRKP
jgi:hypothetical protein